MYKYQNILWLDDFHPKLAAVVSQKFSRKKLKKNNKKNSREDIRNLEDANLESLLSRTTLAYDFDMGEEIINDSLDSSNDYDLIILDCDFPFNIGEERRKEADDWLGKMRSGKWREKERMDSRAHHIPYNFFNFYRNFLMKNNIETETIVFSANQLAPFLAYQLDLPFFLKSCDIKPKKIKSLVKDFYDKELTPSAKIITKFEGPFRDLSYLKNWECGNVYKFTENYLYKTEDG